MVGERGLRVTKHVDVLATVEVADPVRAGPAGPLRRRG